MNDTEEQRICICSASNLVTLQHKQNKKGKMLGKKCQQKKPKMKKRRKEGGREDKGKNLEDQQILGQHHSLSTQIDE